MRDRSSDTSDLQRRFYKLRIGRTTNLIKGTQGHLLSLPVGEQKAFNLISSGGPIDQDSISDFYRKLILEHKTKLIINLCNYVGHFRDYRDDCSQYWPKNVDETLQIDNKLNVTLLESQ